MIRLSREELWLLYSVAYSPRPIWALVLPEDGDEFLSFWNRQHHQMSKTQALSAVHRMVVDGILEIKYHAIDGCSTVDSLDGLLALLRNCNADDKSSRDLYYSLTYKGGALLEQFVRPHWKFACVVKKLWSVDHEVVGCRYIAVSRERTEEFATKLAAELRMPVPQIGVLQPWRVAYWKKLPRGYCVEFENFAGICGTAALEELVHSFSDWDVMRSTSATLDIWPISMLGGG